MSTDDPPSASESAYSGDAAGDLAAPIGSTAQATAQAAQSRATSLPILANVKTLQAFLNAHGYASPSLVVDGKLGPKTSTAIKAFQTARGLIVDGLPGPATYAAMGAASTAAPMPTVFVPLASASAPSAPAPATPAPKAPPVIVTTNVLAAPSKVAHWGLWAGLAAAVGLSVVAAKRFGG